MPAMTPEQEAFMAAGPPKKPSSPDSGGKSPKPGGQSGAPSGGQSGAPSGGQSGAPSEGQSGAPTGGQSGAPTGGKPTVGPYNPYSTCKGEGLHCAREIFDEMSSSKYKQVSTYLREVHTYMWL